MTDSDTSGSDNEENGAPGSDAVVERLELRNSLLKRKREMETEIDQLQKKAKLLQERREVRLIHFC